MNQSDKKTIKKHYHEHTICAQVKFANEASTLVKVIEDMGNPFQEEIDDLLVLDIRNINIAYQAIIQTVQTLDKLGKDQYDI